MPEPMAPAAPVTTATWLRNGFSMPASLAC